MTKSTTTMSPSAADKHAEDPTTMQVRAFLADRGIARHKQAVELATILKLDRSTVFRRFKGKFSWAPQDLRDIAAHFQVPVEQMIGSTEATSSSGATAVEPATLRIPGLPGTAEIVVGG